MRRGRETMRKTWRRARVAASLAVLGALVGCATPGPNHLFLAGAGPAPIHDVSTGGEAENVEALPGMVAPGERVVGLAYDYNTDYLWLRVMPWNQLRVVNRPAKRIEANYAFGEPRFDPTVVSLDLATRSADLHVFAVSDSGRAIVELTRRGVRLREFAIGDGARPIGGLSYDQRHDRLLVLWSDGQPTVAICDRDGAVQHTVVLQAPVDARSLGFDSDRQVLFVPLPRADRIGEFDLGGRLLHERAVPEGTWALDAGPRSMVRVF